METKKLSTQEIKAIKDKKNKAIEDQKLIKK